MLGTDPVMAFESLLQHPVRFHFHLFAQPDGADEMRLEMDNAIHARVEGARVVGTLRMNDLLARHP